MRGHRFPVSAFTSRPDSGANAWPKRFKNWVSIQKRSIRCGPSASGTTEGSAVQILGNLKVMTPWRLK